MRRIKEAFLEMNKVDKIAFIVGQISSITVIICAILQILGIWDSAIIICEICMGISLISQAVIQWKKNRGIAVFSLGVAAFIFAVAVIVLVLR